MPITQSSFTTTPGSTGVKTDIGADLDFDEAIIYFGTSGANNTNRVLLNVKGESAQIPFSPGDKLILSGVDGEELNFSNWQIETVTGGDGVTVIYQRFNPYA